MSKSGTKKPVKAPAAASKPRLVTVEVKLTPAQQKKFQALGGDGWLRDRIDAADAESAANPFKLED
ncbi:hypothetical protein [uncultured Ramlibacter sp.]|uniref:hypothetical protein n=1 Tax=uncultured Ramlibacter sp. TaxID=260755 RepID=UPI00262221FA|nr:hypothetical protein [uncultured Ramlibacter sp.]